MTPEPSEHGTAMRDWRQLHDLRREDVAVGCHVSVTTIANIEAGITKSPSRLFRREVVRYSQEHGIDPPAGW